MALIRCYECGHQVSDMARTCPSCGRSVTVLKENGCSCSNCKRGNEWHGDCERNYGAPGFPCLAYVEEETYY